MDNIIDKVLNADLKTVAHLIRDVEDGIPEVQEYLKALYPHTGKSYIIGVTGAPGVGKSTLIDQLIGKLRNNSNTVAVIAVDPTSPFSDGAILGDRIRMQRHNLDDGVFIKSMATRGHFGGLTQSTRSVINILDAMGSGYIIVETVGVGQDEVDIVKTAHTTVVVTMPGMGDGLQAIKAGGLEIGDIFVINKVHLGGADNTAADISLMLNLDQRRRKENNWTPPVLKIEATSSEEINSLVREIENHKSFLQSLPNPTKAQIAKSKIKNELLEITQARVIQETLKEINESEEFITLVDDIFEKRTDPYSASEKIMPQRFLSLSFAKINRGLGLGEKA